MSPRQKALAAGSPTLLLLLGTLAWNGWENRDRLVDLAIRACARREKAQT